MKREDIYKLIESERENQNKLWPRGEENPNQKQYKFYAPHILVLEEKLARLRAMWYGSEKEALQAEFVKMATIAVRALEEVDV